MKKGKSITKLVCECEHPVHFETDPFKLPPGNGNSNHSYAAHAAYVVRGNYDLLYCSHCDAAGHGQMGYGRRKDAFLRFREHEAATALVSAGPSARPAGDLEYPRQRRREGDDELSRLASYYTP